MKKIVFYIPLFYPNEAKFYKILKIFDRLKVDGVEIGLPAKNPYMDGGEISLAHEQILKLEYSPEYIQKTLYEIKQRFSFQVVLMGYYQDFLDYPTFLQEEKKEYFDAILCVDLPGNKDVFWNIPILNEQDRDEDIRKKIKNKVLFAYVMSSVGKTGRGVLKNNYIKTIQKIKEQKEIPCFVGFHIKTAEDVKAVLTNGADGAIIGSELLKQINTNEGGITNYLRELCECRF